MVNVALVSALIVLSLAIILLNSGCLVVLLSSKKRLRVSSLFLATLLTIHIIQGIIVIPLYTAKRWKLENITAKVAVCDAFRFSYLLTNYLSCITILLISIDRFFAIRFPLKYRVHATRSCAFKIIAASWIYVLLLCLIPFTNTDGECNHNPSKIWAISMLSCNTFFPFVIIIMIYTFISRKSFTFVRNCERRRCIQKREKLPDQRRKSIKTLTALLSKEFAAAKVAVLIAMSYIICWGPSFIYYMLKSTCKHCFAPSFKDSSMEEQLNYAMKFLTLVDGLAAPIIYCLRNTIGNKTPKTSFRSFRSRQSSNRPTSSHSTVVLTQESSLSEIHTLRTSCRTKKDESSLSTHDKDDFSDGSYRSDRYKVSDSEYPSQSLLVNSRKDYSQRQKDSPVLDCEDPLTLHVRPQLRQSNDRDDGDLLTRLLDKSMEDTPGYDSPLDMKERRVICAKEHTEPLSEQSNKSKSANSDVGQPGSVHTSFGSDHISSLGIPKADVISTLTDDSWPPLSATERSNSSDDCNDSEDEISLIT